MLTRFGSHDRKVWAKWSVRGVLAGVAIAAPLVFSAVGRAQQALPPPPSVSNSAAFPGSNELPSLAPVPPPAQGMPVTPMTMPPLPQNSLYPAPAPGVVPGMVPGGSVTPTATSPMGKVSFYQVVVPTRPEEFNLITSKMLSLGVRPDAIQSSYRPLGPHVAIGPFVDQREAEGVSQYLRSSGMNARVFFNR